MALQEHDGEKHFILLKKSCNKEVFKCFSSSKKSQKPITQLNDIEDFFFLV